MNAANPDPARNPHYGRLIERMRIPGASILAREDGTPGFPGSGRYAVKLPRRSVDGSGSPIGDVAYHDTAAGNMNPTVSLAIRDGAIVECEGGYRLQDEKESMVSHG